MGEVQDVYAAAASSDTAVVLEGVHAVKHALRFGGRVRDLVSPDLDRLSRLLDDIAPDLAAQILATVTVVPGPVFRTLSRREPGSPLLAIADRPDTAAATGGPIVVLYEPRHAGNTGAVIRVAAAAGASSVLVTGPMDVWSEPVVRAAAGLHFAIGVGGTDWPLSTTRTTVAFDPDEGDEDFWDVPPDAVLVFGGERHGLPREVLDGVDRVVRIPMRAGVSSLNLATSVAVALYGLQRPGVPVDSPSTDSRSTGPSWISPDPDRSG